MKPSVSAILGVIVVFGLLLYLVLPRPWDAPPDESLALLYLPDEITRMQLFARDADGEFLFGVPPDRYQAILNAMLPLCRLNPARETKCEYINDLVVTGADGDEVSIFIHSSFGMTHYVRKRGLFYGGDAQRFKAAVDAAMAASDPQSRVYQSRPPKYPWRLVSVVRSIWRSSRDAAAYGLTEQS